MIGLPSIFSNHMVLQRRKHIAVWGTDTIGNEITVRLGNNTASTGVVNGKWSLHLPTMEAGGPFTLEITNGTEQISFTDVLVGEVWLAGGQSNMELELQNSDNGEKAVENSKNDRLRFYYTPKVSSLGKALEEAEENSQWMECSPGKTANWSAAAYYFANRLVEELDVPVGIIGCNWGGSIACNWVSRESLLQNEKTAFYVKEYEELIEKQNFEEYLKELEEYKEYHAGWEMRVNEYYKLHPKAEWDEVLAYAGENRWPGPMGPCHEYRPSGLYETMVSRIAPYTLGGAIYYQGESDEDHYEIYELLLKNLIEEWRRVWHDRKLPFGIVQLPVFAGTDEKTGYGWGYIRKAQKDVCETIRNTSLTVITDCGEQYNIHPTDKKTVGYRLAENILKDIFALENHSGNGPACLDYQCSKNQITIYLQGADHGLYVNDKMETNIELEGYGFEIAGQDGIFLEAKARITENMIILWNDKLQNPVMARYGAANFYPAVIKDEKGYPLMPFWI